MIDRNSLISIVVPIYCEENVLNEFYTRIKNVLISLEHEYIHEVIFINDGSTDSSFKILKELCEKDDRIRIINFSRNFGHQAAITAGIEHASGDAVIIIDGDLQDPPEVINDMVSKWKEGYDVVYGKRVIREGEGKFKRITASIFYKLLRKLSDVEIPSDVGDFRLMDRKVVSAFEKTTEVSKYIRGLVSWLGFSQYALPYRRDNRHAGKAKYTIKQSFGLALNGITSFSEKPLYISSWFGLIVMLISFLLAIWVLIRKLIIPETVIPGWTSLLLVILFLGGVQLLSVGIIGIYIGKIFSEAKHRPIYIVSEKYGFKEDS